MSWRLASIPCHWRSVSDGVAACSKDLGLWRPWAPTTNSQLRWVSKIYQKNRGQKGALSDVYSSYKGEKLGECFEWSRSRLLPHIDNNMTIFLSLFGWCFTLPAHILCFCPFDLPRCCESQWRSWHFKRASNPTQATVWDLCMGVSAKKLLQVTHHLEGVKIRTSNSLPLFLSCKRTSILTLKKDSSESTKPTPNKKNTQNKKNIPSQPVSNPTSPLLPCLGASSSLETKSRKTWQFWGLEQGISDLVRSSSGL